MLLSGNSRRIHTSHIIVETMPITEKVQHAVLLIIVLFFLYRFWIHVILVTHVVCMVACVCDGMFAQGEVSSRLAKSPHLVFTAYA